MIIVISPAKTLDFVSPPSTQEYSQPVFLPESARLIHRLKKISVEGLSDLMGVSSKIARLNHARYRSWQQPFTCDNAKQAILAFKGDVYAGLDVASFTAADIRFAQKHLYILSGLYGILRALDLIQPYRLDMGTRLAINGSNNLYQFWDNRISDWLDKTLQARKSRMLINLASNEYFKAIRPERINTEIVTPVFKEFRNGAFKVISFSAKKARGMMSRYIIKNRLRNIDTIKQFHEANYRYRADLSDRGTWVFARG